jgi:glycosyltransferase involved in cell wall biosynthesis
VKKKGIYLIQEPGCLNPHSGAFQHIKQGVKHLSKEFDIDVYLVNQKINLTNYEKATDSRISYSSTKKKNNGIYGTLKDIQLLLLNFLKIPRLYRLIKNHNSDFVYERVSYLDFSGIIACKLARVKHIYEANGLQFESRKKYYSSFLKRAVRHIESMSYKYNDLTFFIGSYGDYWKISKNNWVNVENGIEEQLINKEPVSKTESKYVKLCFVGRPMKHHGLEALTDLFNSSEIKENCELNLIGNGFKNIEEELKLKKVNVVNHGFIGRNNIIETIATCDIGLILNSPDYQSCMKVFDYAAGRLAVVGIDNHNLINWFNDEIYFYDGSIKDLRTKISDLIHDKSLMNNYSQTLHYKVKQNHTWQKTFTMKIHEINKLFPGKSLL